MAKKDPDTTNDPAADAQRALEEKVDAYMNVADEEPAETSAAAETDPPAKSSVAIPVTEVPPTEGAPLLPTDKLPDLNQPKKAKKVEVIDHTDVPEEIEANVPAAETAEPEAAEPEVEAANAAESAPAEPPVEPDNYLTSTPEPPEPPVEINSKDNLGLEDVGMGKAVDEIIAAEADEVLEAHDAKQAPPPVVPSSSLSQKIRHFFSAWWHNKLYRNAAFGVLLVALIALAVVPTSRYAILNTVGVRASTSMTVLDEKTGQPLKNVEVSVSGVAAKTDVEGWVKLEKIKLGVQNLSIKKPAFAEINQQVTIGWGSNPRGEVRLNPVGAQYRFVVTDWLSAKPVEKAEASAGEASALSNAKGEIVLTVPDTNDEDLNVQIQAADYRTESVAVSTTKKEDQAIQLVPSRKHAFVSKRDGTLDVYSIDVDGKNEEKVLKGTGSEREDRISLTIHPTKNIAALISTRDSSHNKDGYPLSVLSVINLDDSQTKTVGRSERIQLVDWLDNKLTYVKIADGTSAASSTRHRLVSYDLESGNEKELASTNYFNDVVSAQGAIYYSPAAYKVNGQVGLFRINADGTNKETVYGKEVWNIFRTAYGKFSVSIGQDWYEVKISDNSVNKVAAAPPQLKSRVYIDSPDGKRSLWVDERDGKGVLILHDKDKNADKTLTSQSGLKTPMRWLSNTHIVYRVVTGQETADYVMNIDGGEAKKIRDVTNTAGIDRWYYY